MVRSSKDIQLLELKDTIAIGTEVVRTEVIFHNATLERIEYVATTYECPACKDTEEPQFIKDNDEAPLVPHSYSSYKHYIGTAKFVLYVGLLSGY